MTEQKKYLIITGSASCVIDDLTALAMDDSMADFMAIGLDAVDKYAWPIRYVATYHSAEIPAIRERREKAGGNTDYLLISHIDKTDEGEVIAGVDIVEPFRPPSGSSSLLGALAALRLGYCRIILCGCPLNDKKYKTFQEGWVPIQKELNDRVRSMSGWTADFLGRPTEEWLNG